MNGKLICGLFCVLALACVSNVRAADAGKRGVNMAQMLLDHADDLGLTADQKTKLEEMAKAPTPLSVLTDEQRKKVREIQQAARGANASPRKEAKTEIKKLEGEKAADGDKKVDGDKKAEGEKKPDTEKKDEK